MSERLTADRGRPPADRRFGAQSSAPGRGSLMAVIVLTGIVLVFAAAIAFWMYWLQGSVSG